MNRQERKQWLLQLWDYHNGLLRPEEVAAVDRQLEERVEARLDSQNVRQIIEELRQSGRWETHPSFPEEMVERILSAESGGKGKWVLLALVAGLILLYFLFFRSGSEQVGVLPEQAPGLSLMASGRAEEEGTLKIDFSSLEQGVEEDLQEAAGLRVRLPSASTEALTRE